MISKSYILDNFLVGLGSLAFGIFTILMQEKAVDIFSMYRENVTLTINVWLLFIFITIVIIYWVFTVKGMKRDPMQDTSMKLADEDKKGYEMRMKKELKITDYFTSIALGTMLTLGAATNIQVNLHTVIGICAIFIGARLLMVAYKSYRMSISN